MGGLDPVVGIADNYRQWAREAHGLSPAYEFLADAVADDRVVLDFLGALPPIKRQPNLLFAAARYVLGRSAATLVEPQLGLSPARQPTCAPCSAGWHLSAATLA
jgi:hypothetical protein